MIPSDTLPSFLAASALLAGTLGQRLNRSGRIQNIVNKAAGTVFVFAWR